MALLLVTSKYCGSYLLKFEVAAFSQLDYNEPILNYHHDIYIIVSSTRLDISTLLTEINRVGLGTRTDIS